MRVYVSGAVLGACLLAIPPRSDLMPSTVPSSSPLPWTPSIW